MKSLIKILTIFFISSGLSFSQITNKDTHNLRGECIVDSLIIADSNSLTQSIENNFDIKLFRKINNYRTSFLDGFLNITDKSMLPVSIALPVTLFAYGRWKNRSYDENTAVLIGVSETMNFLLTGGIKILVKRPRPYIALPNVYYKKTSPADKYSFPSGHASTSFAISAMLTLRYPDSPEIYVPVYIWSLIVAYGRPYWGMHYPTDLFGGVVVGTLSSVAVYSLRKEIIKLKNSVFNEKDKPDINANSNLPGLIAGAYIISMTLNDIIFHSENTRISVIPLHNNSLNGMSISISVPVK